MREFLKLEHTKNGQQVKYEYLEEDTLGNHALYAFGEDGQVVAFINWLNFEIRYVNVLPDWQRQGIATRLYRLASEKAGKDLNHSSDLTSTAVKWVRSLRSD